MRHSTFPVVTKSYWTEPAQRDSRIAIQDKISQMIAENKTDGDVETDTWPPPYYGYRYFVDTAAAQEFIDFCTSGNFQGYVSTEILTDSGPYAENEPPYKIQNGVIVGPTTP